MMLHVFHFDVGHMLTFDMHVALSSVEELKENIEKMYNLPAKNIVLIVKGGEMLKDPTQVSSYSAGTDTNPIYLFLTGDKRSPPTISTLQSDTELFKQVDESLNFPANLETVRRRTMIVELMYSMAQEDQRKCEQHVEEQHLQHQGWLAVVANFEDMLNRFKIRLSNYAVMFDIHLSQRQNHLKLLKNFNDDLHTLSRIPILPGLMSLAVTGFHDLDDMNDRSQMQQESVLKAAATAQTAETVVNAIPITESSSSSTAAVGNIECETSSDDKVVTSTSSTSPNKKQRMGDDDNVSGETTVGDNVVVASSTTATETFVGLANVMSAGSITDAAGNTTTTIGITTPATATTTTTTKEEPKRALQSSEFSSSNLSLLQWIISKEKHNTIRNMTDECTQALQIFDENQYDRLNLEKSNILISAERAKPTEIKGLSTRLSQMKILSSNIKKLVQEQKEFANVFKKNLEGAKNICDNTILPDLCNTHKLQLEVIIKNHQRLRGFCRQILKGKDDTSQNLYLLLNNAIRVQNNISEHDNLLLFYNRFVHRAESHLQIIEQIHRAPRIYVAAVTEVVRRKIFSGEFRLWASKLAEDFEAIHVEEINRRQDFNTKFEGHFLNILFPGLRDMPPSFAKDIVLTFDEQLPNLTKSDIEILTQNIPEIAAGTQLPDMRSMIQFFIVRSGIHQQERIEELLKQEVGGAATANASTSKIDPHIATEKVDRSTTTEAPSIQSVETLTEENSDSLRGQVTRLRNILSSMSNLAINFLNKARASVSNIPADSITNRDELLHELHSLYDEWEVVHLECVISDISDKSEINSLSTRCTTQEENDLKEQLRLAQEEKEFAIAEAREKLAKYERDQKKKIDILQHEQLMAQQRAELEAQKERAIFTALEAERSMWECKILPLNTESVMASMLKDMLEDKERQLDLLREQERMRTQENYQLKARIESLTNEEGKSWLQEKLEYLHRDKSRLEEELNMEKSRRIEMETSVVATIKGSTYERLSSRNISLENCNKNDLVFVVWSMKHWQFMVVQDSSTLYFVHSDSLPALNLTIPQLNPELDNWGRIPMPYYAIGRIQDKELCMARKDENTYRVQRDTTFYRIKLAPLNSRLTARRDEELMSVSTASVFVPVNIAASISVSSAAAGSSTATANLKTESMEASAIKLDYLKASSVDIASEINEAMIEAFKKKEKLIKKQAKAKAAASVAAISTSAINRSFAVQPEEATTTATPTPTPTEADVAAVAAAMSNIKLQHQQQEEQLTIQSEYEPHASPVITEQPTASNLLLNVDSLLANVELEHQQQLLKERQQQEEQQKIEDAIKLEAGLQMEEQLQEHMLMEQNDLKKMIKKLKMEQRKMDDELEACLQMEEQKQQQMLMEQDELDEMKEKLQMEQQKEQQEQQQDAITHRGFCEFPDFGHHIREQCNRPTMYTTETSYTSSNNAFLSAMAASSVQQIFSSKEKESTETTATSTTKEETSASTVASYWNYGAPSINAHHFINAPTFMSIVSDLLHTTTDEVRNAVPAAADAAASGSGSASKDCEQTLPKCSDEYYETSVMMDEYLPPSYGRSSPLSSTFTTPDDSLLDDPDILLAESHPSSSLPMPTTTSTTTDTAAETAETTLGGTFSDDSDEYRSLDDDE